jgi:hypothetical protein
MLLFICLAIVGFISGAYVGKTFSENKPKVIEKEMLEHPSYNPFIEHELTDE